MREKGILIVVSGFSGSGKGTIMKELLKQYDNYALSISATTRNPRPGEKDGREYFFKTVEDFEKMIAKEELWKGLKKALDGAIAQFVQTRTVEGENLKKDLIAKLDGMLELVGQIEERAPKIIAEYREKLEGKVKELLEDTQIDEGRIASEIVIFADKICTDEEVVRLRSHVEHMKATLQSDDSGIGRKLDFIAQEMNREANTILSKANDLETSNIGIELKTEIEKVREQIQNIE